MEPKEIVLGIQQALKENNIDYEKLIDEFGQSKACNQRRQGKKFSINDHLRGIILAMLSNNRPWKPIANNLSNIEAIFFHYDSEKVKNTPSHYFAKEIQAIKCGNRAINAQMSSLKYNLEILNRIESDYNSLDEFVTSGSPDVIAKKLGYPGRYKLQQMGYTLAMEYLKNVGIETFKPDTHVRRLFSNERLGFFKDYPSEIEVVSLAKDIANQLDCNTIYLDNLLWIFCAQDYGEICGAVPKCEKCVIPKQCNYPFNPH